MTLAGVPFFLEGLRTYVSQRFILRTYIVVPCAVAIALLISWPQGALESVYRGAGVAETFSVVSITFLLLLLYFGGRFGAEDYSPETLANLREYAVLTPASVPSLVAGKTIFAIVHTLFLLALGSPFLLAASSVSGAPAGAFGRAFMVTAAATMASRMYGLLLLGIFGQRRLLRSAAFYAGLAASLVVSWLFLPAINPVSVLLAISATSARSAALRVGLSPAALLALADSALALAFATLTALVLLLARGEARRREARND